MYMCTHAIQPHKVKLTKTQRDALRVERERARIEAKAKREAEKQLKEQEKKWEHLHSAVLYLVDYY